jgi:hypothetical protein
MDDDDDDDDDDGEDGKDHEPVKEGNEGEGDSEATTVTEEMVTKVLTSNKD